MTSLIRFTRYNKLFFIFSSVIIICFAVITGFRGGFNFSIDFSSGVIFTLLAEPDIDAREIKQQTEPLFERPVQVQSLVEGGLFGGQRYSLKLVGEDQSIAEFEKQAKKKIEALGLGQIEGSDLVSPAQSIYLRWQTWVLSFFVLLLILLYIWYRFQLRYAIAAIIALLHDTLILIGVIGAFRLDFSSTTVAAVLTVIGYSLNDTIVVFDRIRENRATMHTSNLRDIVDYSVTATLSRTLITSLTTLLSVLAIFLFAYGSVRLFALELIIGIVVGTYSSIYIASSLVLLFDMRRRKSLEGSGKAGFAVLGDAVKNKPRKKMEPPPIRQSAEEIRLATEAKRKKREARRKRR